MEMSSWTTLMFHTGKMAVFKTKSVKNQNLGMFIMKIFILEVIEENSYFKKYST